VIWLLGAVRYALALTLGAAALGKARDLGAFQQSLAGYGLYGPVAWSATVALGAAEGATAAVAFLPIGHTAVGVLGTVLGSVFLASQVYGLVSGKPATCLCFGRAAAEPVSARTAVRAGLVLVAGLLLLIAGSALPQPVAVPSVVAGMALAGGAYLALRTMDG
jgi:hypothetical protein